MPTESNGHPRLDRIEIMLENLAHRQAAIIEHHDAEFKAMLKWQVVTQSHLDDLIKAQKEQGERFDVVISRIGELLQRLPLPEKPTK